MTGRASDRILFQRHSQPSRLLLFGAVCPDSGSPDLLTICAAADLNYWWRHEQITNESKVFVSDPIERAAEFALYFAAGGLGGEAGCQDIQPRGGAVLAFALAQAYGRAASASPTRGVGEQGAFYHHTQAARDDHVQHLLLDMQCVTMSTDSGSMLNGGPRARKRAALPCYPVPHGLTGFFQ